jgi:2-dehydropantoate 2-reductase
LQIVSPYGDVTVQPQLAVAKEIDGTFDAVLLTVKAFSLEAALGDLAPAVGAGTMILPVLNGMKHMETLAARFGKSAVVGCACKVATIVDEQGRIVQLSPLQDIAYGEMDGTVSPRIRQLQAFMQGAGFEARLTPAIALEMWQKWVLLAALGGVTCLMRGTIGEIEAAPGGAAFMLHFLNEVVSVVTAAGMLPSEPFLAFARATLTAKGSPLTSSMYRDLQKGLPIEADHIIGDLLARGRKVDLPTPLIAAAYAHLAVYQNRISAVH